MAVAESKVKLLDLDAIYKPVGRFKIRGEKYDVYPMSVKGMINLSVLTDLEEGADDQAQADSLVKAIDVMMEIFPDCPRDTLDSLTLDQLNALVDFANTLGEDEVEKN
jgi:hypothetical protein